MIQKSQSRVEVGLKERQGMTEGGLQKEEGGGRVKERAHNGNENHTAIYYSLAIDSMNIVTAN